MYRRGHPMRRSCRSCQGCISSVGVLPLRSGQSHQWEMPALHMLDAIFIMLAMDFPTMLVTELVVDSR